MSLYSQMLSNVASCSCICTCITRLLSHHEHTVPAVLPCMPFGITPAHHPYYNSPANKLHIQITPVATPMPAECPCLVIEECNEQYAVGRHACIYVTHEVRHASERPSMDMHSLAVPYIMQSHSDCNEWELHGFIFPSPLSSMVTQLSSMVTQHTVGSAH